MKKYTKTNIDDISLEDAHGGSGQRQVLVKPEHLTTEHFEAMTKGYLNPEYSYDWHYHKDTDEMFIVLKGEGIFYWETVEVPYKEGDIITIPANTQHKITATGDSPSENYFIRIKV
jgi:mannose-6-phosphate isomerase-like protein (cupin superfamily)